MALPAGRYGVTKNQLLKIKKLPMNTIKLIEELTEKFDLLGTAAFKNSTTVVTQSTDLVESGAVYTALQGKADNSVIGTVEDGINPTKAYAVGEHMIRGGKFCTVTVAVTTSSTWTEGSNYTSGDVASELDNIGTYTKLYDGNIYLTNAEISLLDNYNKYTWLVFELGINSSSGGFDITTVYCGKKEASGSVPLREYLRLRYYDASAEQHILLQIVNSTKFKIIEGSQSSNGHGIRAIYGIK